MSGGPPAMVRSPLADRTLVVEFFVNLFEVLGMEAEIRAIIGGRHEDFRVDVERWLRQGGFKLDGEAP
jgi:hypothetical protein